MLVFLYKKSAHGPIRGTMGILPKIHRDIGQKVGSAVYDTLRNGDSAVYLTLTVEWRLGSVSYTAEWRLHGVSYTAEFIPRNSFALFCSLFK